MKLPKDVFENIMMTVYDMRAAQRLYFCTRRKDHLAEAKRLELVVDETLAAMLDQTVAELFVTEKYLPHIPQVIRQINPDAEQN